MSIIDTFLLGNLVNKPPLVKFVSLGTLILNVELVDIPADKILPLLTSVTPTPNGDNVNCCPSADISLTLLKTWSVKLPWKYPIILSVFIPTLPENLRFATVAVFVEEPPNTERLSVKEKLGNTRSKRTESALKLDAKLETAFCWNTDLISSVV